MTTDDDETALVPTALAPPAQTAWAECPDEPEAEAEAPPWPTAWGVAAVLLASALVAAFVIAVVGWAVNKAHDNEPPPWPGTSSAPTSWAPIAASTVVATVSLPTTVTVAAPAPRTVTLTPEPTTVTAAAPVPTADPGDVDRDFLAALRRNQITIYDQSKVLLGAHWVCTQLSSGTSKVDTVSSVKRINPDLTEMGAIAFVADSIVYYCPQYEGPL